MNVKVLRRTPAPRPAIAAEAMAWTLLYVLGIWYADVFVVGPSQITLFWPAAGIAFALVVSRGLGWAAITSIAVLISHATFAQVPVAFVPFSVMSNLLGSLAGAYVVRAGRVQGADTAIGAFVITGGAVAMAAVSAGVGAVGLYVADMVPPSALPGAYAKWALGDLLGIACIAPTLLLLTQGRSAHADAPPTEHYARGVEKTAWAAAFAAAYGFVYWVGLQNSGYALGMVAVPLALLLWSALRFQPLWTAAGAMVSVFVIATLLGLGLAAFQPPQSLLDVLLLLGFLNLFATVPLLLAGSINDQRVAARRALRQMAESALQQQAELERLVTERTQQLDEANRQLEHASQTDALTGLRNRRYVARQLPLDLAFYGREAGNAHTPPHALFFALVDIDHFKAINDTRGHKAGDEVLQQFAGLLTGLIRSSDYAVRWGGEEFLLVLRPMPAEHVATLGERICRTIATHPFVLSDGSVISISCSVGFAEQAFEAGESALSWENLVELADASLYWVKQNGRNGWAVLRPQAGHNLAGLARDARQGAQALIASGSARVNSHRDDVGAHPRADALV
ncbi:sensor domain-containing diguanylate cyclase [Cognatilysobacter lacus]|uniref:diguanylate cyclase n=1 Tax=Cognatilysobacter lacus TaxID=1643323 RepID=A0A5D8Z9Q8_9GAMM|nr:diguanylate cyclase [Lysobacter lacus]TZF90793.1 diguanylate cyclase [Lysobacter lacus]